MSWIWSIVIVIIVIYFQFAHLAVLTWLTNLCIISQGYGIDGTIDRVPKKSKISERPAEFTVHSRDNSKNFLLKEF